VLEIEKDVLAMTTQVVLSKNGMRKQQIIGIHSIEKIPDRRWQNSIQVVDDN